MPAKFAHLKQLKQRGDEPRPYIIQLGDLRVRLHLLPATSANKPYWNEVFRMAEESASQQQGPAKKTANEVTETAIEGRLKDARVFAQHNLVGWDEELGKGKLPNLDPKGKPIPFSQEEGLEFMLAIAEFVDYEFDKMRAWLVEPRNFVGKSSLGN